MKAKYLFTSLAFLTSIGSVHSAFAQTAAAGFAVNRFEPSERGSEWFALESLDFRGETIRPAIGVVVDYMYRPLVIYGRNSNGDEYVNHSVVRDQLNLHAGLSFVLFERLRLAANLPIALYNGGHSGTLNGVYYASPPDEQAIGDVRLGLDLRLLGQYGDPFVLAVGAQVWLPTGSQKNYMSDDKVRVAPRIMIAGDLGPLAYALRASYIYRGLNTNYDNQPIGSEFGYAASLGLRLFDRAFVIGPEIFGSTVISSDDPSFSKAFQSVRSSPIEGIIGAHLTVGSFRIGAGAGTGLNRGYGAPEFRLLGNLEWQPAIDEKVEVKDQDLDGIPDDQDRCPTVPGVRSEDPAKNGCPPDRDNDNIIDAEDACPDVPGDPSEDKTKNGCPADRDGDGIPDKEDACVDVKGVRSDDPKKNGCPGDTDGDGILDPEDACVDKPGIKTSDPKTNGCPDPDPDKDGIDNSVDACPNLAGKPDPDPKRNGCPPVRIEGQSLKILDQIKFKTGSAAIEKGKDSEEILQAILKTLNENPTITHLRVEGHTDNKGNAAANKRLSKARAESVVKWLVGHGKEKSMFIAQGWGQDKPIDDNSTDAGRRNNRRTEFIIMSDDEVKTWEEQNKPAPKGKAKPKK